MAFSWWLVLFAAPLLATAAASDPSCEHGIRSGNTCCASSCGTCGSPGCGARPGGAAQCCIGPIAAAAQSCDSHDAPCVIGPSPPPPAPVGPINATVTVDGDSAIFEVDERYVSYTLDASAWRRTNLTDATLLFLTKSLGPSILRVGGTQADFDVYAFGPFESFDCEHPPAPMTPYRCRTVTEEQWRGLHTFASEVDAKLVYGLNDMFRRPTKEKKERPLCTEAKGCPPRNQSNIHEFLKWTVENLGAESQIMGWELGNELNTCLNGEAGAKAQADDFIALRSIVSQVYSLQGLLPLPILIGPDTHSSAEFSRTGLEWFEKFHSVGAVDAYAFHMYSMGNGPKIDPRDLNASFLNATALDKSAEGAAALASIVKPAGVRGGGQLWAGETASANDGGQSGVTDSFIDGFWYIDSLGGHASSGVDVFCRQTLQSVGGYPLIENYNPLPDYWLALLWKRLMGKKVLKVTSSSTSVRVYAHCAAAPAGEAGSISLAWLNIGSGVATVKIDQGSSPMAGPLDTRPLLWVLEAGAPMKGAVNPLQSQEVKLNGVHLTLRPGPALPSLEGVRSSGAASTIRLPPSSYGFAVLPDIGSAACTAASTPVLQTIVVH